MGRKNLGLSMRKKKEAGENDTNLMRSFTFVQYA
jgi:hypothetical protein